MSGFDTLPTMHTALSFLFGGGLLIWQLFFSHRWRGWFVPATLAVFFFLRLPSITYNREINPDESQMVTQALTLGRYDPVYFRSVDGTTGGPLDSYFLVLPSLFGLPFDYITAHLMACFLITVCLWLLYRTARYWSGQQSARLALLPVMLTLGFTQNADFLHYSSELIAVLLLSGAYALYARQTTTPALPRIGMLFLAGFLLGMVPFGKLQGVPSAVIVVVFITYDIVARSGITIRHKTSRVAALVAGLITFPALFACFMAVTGRFSDFITFYLEANLNYGSKGNPAQNLLNLPRLLRKGDEFFWLVVLTLTVSLSALTAQFVRSVRVSSLISSTRLIPQNTPPVFLLALTTATIFAITRTGSEYVHYLYFLIGPLLLGLAFFIKNAEKERVMVVPHLLYLSLFFLLGVQAVTRYVQFQPINRYPTDRQMGWQMQTTSIGREIKKFAQTGEPLVVWGWRCDYYVETQMPQGVAENHTIRSVFIHPMVRIYQARYVRDFARTMPPVFVDAVGNQNLWMTDRKTQGHEIIKPLGRLVRQHYQFVGLFDDARLYVRKDRLATPVVAQKPV